MDPELLQDIAIQIRIDNPAPNDRMGYSDYQAAKSIWAFANAIDKIAERRMEESLAADPKPKVSATIELKDNAAVCPFCRSRFVSVTKTMQPSDLSEAFRLHVQADHPRKYKEFYTNAIKI